MSVPAAPHRRAFTLIELLVVLGIVGVLAGLLLPAAQAAREAARRSVCASNLRQLGLAVASYADAFLAFPPGRTWMGDPRFAGPDPRCTSTRVDQSPLVRVLPYLEQAALFHAINQDTSIFSLENTTIHAVQLGVLACPTDPESARPRELEANELAPMAPDPPGGPRRMAATSYALTFGSFDVVALPSFHPGCVVPPRVFRQGDGVFSDVSPIRPADVRDGLGQTLFASEKAVATFDTGPGSGPGRHGWWVSGNLDDALYSAFYQPNAFRRLSVYGSAARVRSASSLHPGGAHALMGDGSIRFLKESIDSWPVDPVLGRPLGATRNAGGWWENLPRPGVWQRLATRAGGETIGADAP